MGKDKDMGNTPAERDHNRSQGIASRSGTIVNELRDIGRSSSSPSHKGAVNGANNPGKK